MYYSNYTHVDQGPPYGTLQLYATALARGTQTHVVLLEFALKLLLELPRNLHWGLQSWRRRTGEQQHAGVGVQRVHLHQRAVASRMRDVQHCLCSSIELQRQRWQQRRARGSWRD